MRLIRFVHFEITPILMQSREFILHKYILNNQCSGFPTNLWYTTYDLYLSYILNVIDVRLARHANHLSKLMHVVNVAHILYKIILSIVPYL